MPFIYYAAAQHYPFPSIVDHTIRASLMYMDEGFLPSPELTHMIGDIPSSNFVLTSGPLSGKSFEGGIFRANDVQFGVVPDGIQVDGVLLWHDTGDPATSRPLAWLDNFLNLPAVGDGVRKVKIVWPANGIFGIGRSQ